jgi:drug/metabolite transporter (DMT)-like permease
LEERRRAAGRIEAGLTGSGQARRELGAMTPPAHVSDARARRLADAALAGAGVLWGASFPLGKLALDEVGPGWLVLYRFLLASAALLPLVRWRTLRLTRRDLAGLVGSSFLLGPAMFLVQFEGLARTTASSAALLVATAPPLMAAAATFVDGERAGRRTWAGIALSSVGIGLLAGLPGPGRTLLGDGLVFASMLAAVAWTLATRRLARRLGVRAATALQFALGALWLAPFAVLREGAPPLDLSPLGWGTVVALGFGCTTLTYLLWTWGLQHTEAARAGVYGNLEPVVGATLGVLWLGDVLGPTALAGGALVLGAALLVTTSTASPDVPTAAPPVAVPPGTPEPAGTEPPGRP